MSNFESLYEFLKSNECLEWFITVLRIGGLKDDSKHNF